MRTTIKDIAKEAGVSIATVSRVLNRNTYVTEEIKNKVLKAAEDLNYIPNTAAKSLKTQRSGIVGFIISDISSDALLVAARSAERVFSEQNYNLILCSTENDPEREKKYLNMLMSKNVDGIVLNTTGKNVEEIVNISRQIPMVLYNRNIEDPHFRGDLVDTNNFEVSYGLTKQLLTLGHKRIMAICGPSYLSNSVERLNGFKTAMQEAGIEVGADYPYLYSGDFSRQTGKDAIAYMMTLKEQPTAILSQNTTMSIGALEQCNIMNIKVPGDISFISYDGIPNAELMRIIPTSATYDVAAMGEKIGYSMLERIQSPELANRKFIFNPDIVLGNSLSLAKPDPKIK